MILVGKPKRKRSLERPKRRREDNMKMNPKEINLENVDWSTLTENRGPWRDPVNTVINIQVP